MASLRTDNMELRAKEITHDLGLRAERRDNDWNFFDDG